MKILHSTWRAVHFSLHGNFSSFFELEIGTLVLFFEIKILILIGISTIGYLRYLKNSTYYKSTWKNILEY